MTIVHPIFVLIATAVAIFACAVLARRWPSLVPAGRYQSIDGLRGYLAFFVFLHHAVISYFFVLTGTWAPPPSHLFTHLGQASVAFFFMITGFLFYGKILDSCNRVIDWPRFFIARTLRLTPLYAVAMVAALVLVYIESKGVLVVSFGNLLKSVVKWFLFTAFGGPDVNGVPMWRIMAGVNWSLPYEWYFYLCMPLLALTRSVSSSWQLKLLGVAAIAFATASSASLFFVAVFGCGAAAALAVRNPVFLQLARTKSASILVLASISLLVVQFSTAYGYPQLVLLMLAFSLIAAGNDLFGLLSARLSHHLGELSYSIYLLHGMLIFCALNYVIGYEEVRSMSVLAFWGLICGLVPLLLLIATATFRAIELPAMQITPLILARMRSKNRRPVLMLNDPLADGTAHDRSGAIF